MQQTLDLETLQHILEQYNKDVLNDCSRIICKLLNSLTETALLEDHRIFTSLKVLLGLYEKISADDNRTNIRLPISPLIQNVKRMIERFNCSSEDGFYSDTKMISTVLSIIQSVFKISYLENSGEALEEFAKLYMHILTFLCSDDVANKCKSDYVIFNLKIINTIYTMLQSFSCESSWEKFYDKSKTDYMDESDVYRKLTFHNDNRIAMQTLLIVIPEYLNCFNFKTVLEKIWEEISKSVNDSSIDYLRAMSILCSFFEKADTENQISFTLTLFEDANFWELLQSVLVENDPILKKQGMYVFKKSVELLKKTDRKITCSKSNIIFYWDSSLKNELYALYNDVITILEYLDEQQAHIVTPIFKLAKSLCTKVVECDKVNLMWVFLIYHKALNHENIKVIKWGMTEMFNLPLSFFTEERNAKKTVTLLMPILNCLDIYYNDGQTVSQNLSSFLSALAPQDNAKIFFHLFVEEMCSVVWSPEALYFVANALNINGTHNILRWREYSMWGEHDISLLKTFVKQRFKTFHKIIQIGIQCHLLYAIATFTDVKNVSFKNIMLLISSFPMMESPDFEGETWSKLQHWLLQSDFKEEYEEVLDFCKKQQLGEEFNEKFVFLLNRLSRVISSDDLESDIEETPIEEILLLFKDINRRPYCDRKLYDYYLSVISHFAANNGLYSSLFIHLADVLYYVQNQLKSLRNLKEFHTCEFYLNAFKNIIKMENSFEYLSKEINDFYTDVVGDLKEMINSESNISSVVLYSWVKMLDILLQGHPCKVELSFLVPYFLTNVNEPLQKDKTYCEQTKDIQTLWGKMNSEFIAVKWNIFKYFIKEKLMDRGAGETEVRRRISEPDLVQLCMDGLSTGGYGVLNPAMSILQDVLPNLDDYSQVKEIISSLWKLIMERKKTDEFKLLIKTFVEMLFQEALILKGESFEEILKEYADIIFSHPSLAVVNLFIRHIQKIDLTRSNSLYCHIIGKALLFGSVLKKDEKLTNAVCFQIMSCKIYACSNEGHISSNYCWNEVKSSQENFSELYTSNEVRARAVEKVLRLDKHSPKDQAIVKNLMDTLIKVNDEDNRKRYFTGSYVHRVKHRVLQSLLILDHLVHLDEDETQKLLQWLWNGLTAENPQLSVRYQQKWLIVRILLRNPKLFAWLFSFFKRNEAHMSKRSLCSYLVIVCHFCRLCSDNLVFPNFSHWSTFLFHQNFEVRLYALVLFHNMFSLALRTEQEDFTQTWSALYNTQCNINNDEQVKKNFEKLLYSFFLHEFHPLKHYGLDMIYWELPKVADVPLDERISVRLFRYCGVDPSKVGISLNTEPFFYCSSKIWKDSHREDEFEDQDLIETLKNYQKKIIPMKSLSFDVEEESTHRVLSKEGDGLVVVASLVDRIPNLGGIARTCEIFGVSELVLGSLKYTEDKQFTSLSVTAEKWITVKEVKPQDLITYIREMKENEYTVIGAEQTLLSKPLNSVKFPKKTLLLLGNEKEGIPPNILPFLDICVEIPQRGIIRSLNVHVTGALFIWEYAKQIFFS